MLAASPAAFGGETAGGGRGTAAPQAVLAGGARLPRRGLPVDAGKPQVSGPHRFLRIGGKTGYQPLSLKTSLRVPSNVHAGSEGTILLSICPMETLAVAAGMRSFLDKTPNARPLRW